MNHVTLISDDSKAEEEFYKNATPKTEPEEPKAKFLKFATPAEVARAWKNNPIVHEKTGLTRLDDSTGGGFVYGSRVYLLGAPDAAKTMILVMLAHEWAKKNVAVGLIAADEEADDVVGRLAQRLGHHRSDCEARSDSFVEKLTGELVDLGIYLYDPETTIETAAEHLAQIAKEKGTRSALLLDSVQTVICDTIAEGERERSQREVVQANVRAIRKVATTFRHLVVTTSEMNRMAYKTLHDSDREQDDMAAGKESGAIEYSARVMLSLRRIKDEPSLVKACIVKNKHGDSGVEFHLTMNRATQDIVDADTPDTKENEDSPEFIAACAAVHQIIIDTPKINKSTLAAALKEAGVKMGQTVREAALLRLIKMKKIEEREKSAGKPNAGYQLFALVMKVEEPQPAAPPAEPVNDNAHVSGMSVEDV